MPSEENDIYATKNLPPFNYDWLTERVAAGRNPLTCGDVQTLCALGITHVLDLREPHEWAPPRFGAGALEEIGRCGLQRLNLVVTDMGAPTPQDFEIACRFLEEAMANPDARVYVHCRAGMERTAAILIAWHAKRNDVSFDEAFAELKKRRPILHPLPGQERAARQWLDESRQSSPV